VGHGRCRRGRHYGRQSLLARSRTIFLDHPLQRRFQDVEGALGHAFLVPDPLAKAVGGARLGTTHPELVL
jgi:3-hydroxy-9,10-secoandrosta-1,3,5(10)-triene-9,17-dione monooxygenase